MALIIQLSCEAVFNLNNSSDFNQSQSQIKVKIDSEFQSPALIIQLENESLRSSKVKFFIETKLIT